VKVAVVCPYDLAAFGGVQGQVMSLVQWLNEAGHQAWAVAPGSGGPAGTLHLGPVVSVRSNRSRAPITLHPGAVPRLKAAVAGADVVHIHEPLVPMVGWAALLASTSARVGTFHADPSATVRRLYRVAGPFLRRVTGRLDIATAVSPVAASAVEGFVETRIVPNGLEVARYRSGAVRVPARVLFVGRDDPRKGLDVLLQAWPLVRAALPEATLEVVGTKRASGPDGVTFLGRVSDEEKLRRLGEATVLCAPNLGGESFGLVVAEGMAAGCAVVASDLTAFRAVAGDAALLVAPGNVPDLAAAICRAAGNPAEAARLGSAAVAAAARFDRAAVLEGYLTAYRSAMGAR
jgi:phosphatidylinositol alpha-mannosyltransferase